jgi:hypothetical protein
MVNRVWQYHFGQGIVRTSSDFGYQGTPPTHPELLDWLASEFVADGMKLKPLHKRILMSNTYRMASTKTSASEDQFSHFVLRRLSAEEVRDSILAVSGNLNRKMGGPSIYPRVPEGVLAGQSNPATSWDVQCPPEEQNRRSVYIHVRRSLPVPILAAFDTADTDQSCPVRFTTTQPTQALAMFNSEFLHEQAGIFAAHVRQKVGSNPVAQVHLGLRRVLQREPTPKEIERGVRLLRDLQRDSNEDALRAFCLMAFNLNEFIFLD